MKWVILVGVNDGCALTIEFYRRHPNSSEKSVKSSLCQDLLMEKQRTFIKGFVDPPANAAEDGLEI